MEDIEGTLSIADKIWFNDKERCRLRICGFTKEQVEEMKDSKFIDITLKRLGDRLVLTDYMEAYISISKE